MGRESISRKTFVKGLAAGVILAASLGTLQTGDYVIRSNGSLNAGADENSPANAQPETAGSAAVHSEDAPVPEESIEESEAPAMEVESEKETEALTTETEKETEASGTKEKAVKEAKSEEAGTEETDAGEAEESETEKNETK